LDHGVRDGQQMGRQADLPQCVLGYDVRMRVQEELGFRRLLASRAKDNSTDDEVI